MGRSSNTLSTIHNKMDTVTYIDLTGDDSDVMPASMTTDQPFVEFIDYGGSLVAQQELSAVQDNDPRPQYLEGSQSEQAAQYVKEADIDALVNRISGLKVSAAIEDKPMEVQRQAVQASYQDVLAAFESKMSLVEDDPSLPPLANFSFEARWEDLRYIADRYVTAAEQALRDAEHLQQTLLLKCQVEHIKAMQPVETQCEVAFVNASFFRQQVGDMPQHAYLKMMYRQQGHVYFRTMQDTAMEGIEIALRLQTEVTRIARWIPHDGDQYALAGWKMLLGQIQSIVLT